MTKSNTPTCSDQFKPYPGVRVRVRVPYPYTKFEIIRTCFLPALTFENQNEPVPFPHQHLISTRTRPVPVLASFKTNPYPYQDALILLRFRKPIPVLIPKYHKIIKCRETNISEKRCTKNFEYGNNFFLQYTHILELYIYLKLVNLTCLHGKLANV